MQAGKKKKDKKKNANTDRPRHTAPPLGRLDHLIHSPHETWSPWLSPASATCFSFVLFADSYLGAHGGHQASAHESYFFLLFGAQSPSSPSLPQGFLTASPNCALQGVRARMAFGMPPSQPLPGPVSRVEMSNAAGGEISKSTSLPPTSWL